MPLDKISENLVFVRKYRPDIFMQISQINPSSITDENSGWYDLAKMHGSSDDLHTLSQKIIFVHGVDALANMLRRTEYHSHHYWIIIEHSIERFYTLLLNVDCTKVLRLKNWCFVIGRQIQEFDVLFKDYLLQSDRLAYADDLLQFCGDVSLSRFGEYYLASIQSFKRVQQQLSSLMLSPAEDAYRGFINLVANYDKIKRTPTIDAMQNSLSTDEAVIVSSGPSLDEQLNNLKKFGKRKLLICSDSSFRVLQETGVEPDFVMCLERDRVVSNLFEGTKPTLATLITLPTVDPNVIENFKGPIRFVSRENAYGRWLWPHSYFMNVGNNVASMGLRFAAFLGARIIYFLGQDLAYAPFDMRSHHCATSVKTLYVENQRIKSDEAIETLCHNGGMIKTNVYWSMYRDQLSNFARKFNLTCYNVMPRDWGAVIPYFQHLEPDLFWQAYSCQSADFKLRAVQNCSDSSCLTADIHRTIAELNEFKLNLLDYDDVVSRAVQDDLPEVFDDDTLNRYLVHFRQWRGIEDSMKMLHQDGMWALLRPFVLSQLLSLLKARNHIDPQVRGSIDVILNYVNLTHEIVKLCVYWIDRIERQLQMLDSHIHMQQNQGIKYSGAAHDSEIEPGYRVGAGT